jgi:hypothetical protein
MIDTTGRQRRGWPGNYFRVLEQAAVGAYRNERERLIQADFVPFADLRADSRPRGVLYEIAGDVPLHELFNFTRQGFRDAVEQGYRDGVSYYDRLPSKP